MPRTLVAIHQPNFLPWLGYFDKIARADVFCLMDNVQLPKKGGSWTNRVRVRVGHEASWVTVPVARGHGTQLIGDVRIDDSGRWRERIKRTIEQSYRRAAAFDEAWPLVEGLIDHDDERLADYNEHAIRVLCRALDLDDRRLVRGSSLHVDGAATDLLLAMVRAAGGDAYLCGGGAGGYQHDEAFAAAGLELRYQDFVHPEYPQAGGGPFLAGLSVVDALMNCGFAGSARLLGVAS